MNVVFKEIPHTYIESQKGCNNLPAQVWQERSVLHLHILYIPKGWTCFIIKEAVGIWELRGNIYSFVYITGPGVDWEVTHPACCHLTNINPISLKDWTLCLHMGPKWDYLVQTDAHPTVYASVPRVKKINKCPLLLSGYLGFLLVFVCTGLSLFSELNVEV